MNACEPVTMCGEVQVPEHHLEVRKNKRIAVLDQSPTIYLFLSCQGKTEICVEGEVSVS